MSQNNKISLSGLLTWIICTLFFMYEFLLRTIPGTFQTALMSDLYLTSMQFALLSTSVYQLIYGVMQIPIGIIVDYMGLKKTLFIALLLCTIANFGFALSHQFVSAIFFRMLIGLGSSCGFICLLIAIYDWMPKKNVALFIGMSQFIGTLGPMFAAGPLNAIAHSTSLSWREIFFYLGVLGGILSVAVLLCVKNNRQQQAQLIFLFPEKLAIGLKRLVKQKQIWLIALYSACVYFSIEYLTENESSQFLVKKGFSLEFSSYMLTLAWLGYAIACPLLGFISDKMQRRKPFMVLCAGATFLSLLMIIYVPLSQHELSFFFIILGSGAAGSIIGFAMMAEQCSKNTLAAGMGLNNTMIVLSTALNAPLIGYYLSHLSIKGNLQLIDYQMAFAGLLILALCALMVAIFYIKETFCKSMCENTLLKIQNMPET